MRDILSKRIGIGAAIAALAMLALVGVARRGDSQPAGTPPKLTVGIYTPTVLFATSQARLAYVQSLAKAIEANVNTKVEGRSYTSMGQLSKAGLDFAIIDGQCYAANMTGKLLANGEVDGGTSRQWALYSSLGPTMQALRGKKLAFVKMGCKDTAFLENAMLESEVGLSFFSGQVGKPDLGGTVAEVVSRKGAEAVFAPSGSQKGLTKVFDTGSVPNPAFVQLNDALSADLVGKVKAAVVRYGGGGAISGWKDGDAESYRSLRGRMGTRVKEGVFSSPEPVRVDAKDILIEPTTLSESDLTQIKQHFQPPAERQE
jgi:hypothetical protein